MTSVRALYARFRHLIHEGARFGVVGLLGLVITDGVANLLHYRAGLGSVSSVAIAMVIATAVTFVGNRYWTYRHRERTGLGRETFLFFGLNGIGVAITEVPVMVADRLHLGTGLPFNIAVNGGIAVATLFRYWAYRKWVWRTSTAPASAALPAPAHRQPADRRRTLRLVRLLHTGFRQLGLELAAFSVVSASAFVVVDAGTVLLHFQVGVGRLTSNVIATAVATVVSYAGNRYWTFRRRRRSTVAREGSLFLMLSTAGLVIQLACLVFSPYVLGSEGKLPYDVALVAGIALSSVFRYWSYRTWVWQAQPPRPQSRKPAYVISD